MSNAELNRVLGLLIQIGQTVDAGAQVARACEEGAT
jgi:hypothetical protein